jgi:hypothetical protein
MTVSCWRCQVNEVVVGASYVQECVRFSMIPEFNLQPKEGARTSVGVPSSGSGRIRVKVLRKNFEGGTYGPY